MICYRDMTFCPFNDCINFDKCGRALTEDVKQAASWWWGNTEAPIATWEDKPECFVEDKQNGSTVKHGKK